VILVIAGTGYLIVTKKITGPIVSMANRLEQSDKNADLTVRISNLGSDELGLIGKGINNLLINYSSTVAQINEVNASIASISGAIEKISDDNIDMSKQQMAELEMAATAMEEMTVALSSVAESTSMAENHAAKTETESCKGNDIFEKVSEEFKALEIGFDETSEIISQLATESNNVGNVLEVIKSIAEQTNLLALNAAIEAARAGESGRGFAVVADEVRTLAQRTQESTIEIESIISNLQNKATQATSTMKSSTDKISSTSNNISDANGALSTIQGSAGEIHQLNTSIASATEQQSAVSGEISNNITNVRDISHDIATKISELKPMINEMTGNADQLNQMISRLKID